MRRLSVLVVACLSVLTAGCLNVLTPPGDAPLRYRDDVFTDVTTTANITYGSATNQLGEVQSLELDLYRPTGDTVTSRPAIVWIHGGGFAGGTKTSTEIVAQAQAFARKGYVSVSIEYRLVAGGCSAGGITQACLRAIVDAQHDAQAAVRFLRANASTYGVDTTRIASAGTSAGAITALHVAYNSEDPGTSGNPGPSSAVRSAVSLSGARFFGPVTAADPPSLLFHGTNDFVVPYQWAVNTVNAVQAASVVSILHTFPGAGHVPIAANFQTIIDETRNFFYWTMDLAQAAQ
jgi:acetyl esterase/lipase